MNLETSVEQKAVTLEEKRNCTLPWRIDVFNCGRVSAIDVITASVAQLPTHDHPT